MRRQYFGPQSQIIGVDINPICASLAEPGIEIVIGDPLNSKTHQGLREKYGDFDIIIDDGGHTMQQQITTFTEMYRAVKLGGIYLAEDLHTSYLPDEGGGLDKKKTSIEYSKSLIDQLHAWYSTSAQHQPDYVTASIFGQHFYDLVLVIETAVIKPPEVLTSGHAAFPASAMDYSMLAQHCQRKGKRQEPVKMCQVALCTDPNLAEARTLLATLQA